MSVHEGLWGYLDTLRCCMLTFDASAVAPQGEDGPPGAAPGPLPPWWPPVLGRPQGVCRWWAYCIPLLLAGHPRELTWRWPPSSLVLVLARFTVAIASSSPGGCQMLQPQGRDVPACLHCCHAMLLQVAWAAAQP